MATAYVYIGDELWEELGTATMPVGYDSMFALLIVLCPWW